MEPIVVVAAITSGAGLAAAVVPTWIQVRESRKLSTKIGEPNGHGDLLSQVEGNTDGLKRLGRRVNRLEDSVLKKLDEIQSEVSKGDNQ